VGSGLILQPTGLTVLAALGLLDRALTLGSRIDRLHGADARSGRTVLDVRYDAGGARGRFGLAMHRAALFDVLHEAVIATGIAVEAQTEVIALDPAARPWLVTVGGRRLGPFDLVVDASGARSRLKAFARVPVEPRPLAYGAFWSTLAWRGADFDPNALQQRYRGASVMIGILPIGRPAAGDAELQAAFFWSLKPASADRVRERGLAAWKAEVSAHWPQTCAYLDQIADFGQLTLARYGHHTLPYPAGRGLAVIGDAAHSTSPQLGQGANMALLDAAALAHALASTPDMETALDAYCRARRWHVRLFQMLSLAFTPFYQSDSVMIPLLRDTLVATLAKVPPAPRLLASMVAGTTVDPFGSIGREEHDWRGLRAQGWVSQTI
jgi:2-polyprenyl-6-methoxyphenol hydroxylase-like FAD-dependent oxidoreductase